MKIPATLSRYLGGRFLKNLTIFVLVLLGLIYLFDTVELIRRASKRPDLDLSIVLEMGLFKLPEAGQVIFPFAVLFAAMYTFWQINRNYELIVVRAAGMSVWQFLSPVLGMAFVVGIIFVSVINPVSSIFLGKFEQMESKHLSGHQKLVTFFQEGLWLRQGTDEGYVIMHSEGIDLPEWKLSDVVVFFFSDNNDFLSRIDAKSATLNEGMWFFKDAYLSKKRQKSEAIDAYVLPTVLTPEEIEESFSSPQTMSFWKLPGFIKILETTGFNASKLRIHFQSLIAQPLLFAAMILIAACVSLRPPRLAGSLPMMGAGILFGFIFFFLSSYLHALGASGQIPVIMAAWSAPLISFLLGLGIIMNLEDG
jgi:lipopolysaccharide export system permease protein